MSLVVGGYHLDCDGCGVAGPDSTTQAGAEAAAAAQKWLRLGAAEPGGGGAPVPLDLCGSCLGTVLGAVPRPNLARRALGVLIGAGSAGERR